MTLNFAARVYAVTAFILCSFFVSTSALAAEKYANTISIVEGQTRLMKIPGVMRVSIGHPEVANAQATGPDEVLLTGLSAGVTDVRVWKDNGSQTRYLLKVVDTSWVQILEIANIVLADVEGVNAREENGIVFIEGRILREQDITIIEDMKKKLQKETKAGSVVFNVVRPSVSLQAMIMLDVQVVEVRKDDLKNIGVEWNVEANGPFFEILGEVHGVGDFDKTSSFFGFGLEQGSNIHPLTEIGSTLRLLQQKGVARVLAQPKLVTKSGSKAEFLAGGEIPLPFRNNDGDLEVSFKQVGVILDMEPVADPDGFIATKINVEVSEVDSSIEVLGIPGFTARRTMMEMNAQSGQTMVISGILKAEDSKSVNKLPGLGSIPIIGELFKSRDFVQRTTELVIFVTPYLIDPDSKMNRDMLDYSNDLIESAEEKLKFDLFD
ncbi:MAG: pilus assembly protein N-terminal domain-containing protein [Pseudomonadales bacterium]|nr:pilus assembly protein N-terminal domain-containing protein [Pseudomonadales bacterium]